MGFENNFINPIKPDNHYDSLEKANTELEKKLGGEPKFEIEEQQYTLDEAYEKVILSATDKIRENENIDPAKKHEILKDLQGNLKYREIKYTQIRNMWGATEKTELSIPESKMPKIEQIILEKYKDLI